MSNRSERYANDDAYREAQKNRSRAYYESHKQEIKERLRLKLETNPDCRVKSKEWYSKNKDKSNATTRRSRLVKIYGVTIDQDDKMVEFQQDKCAICQDSGSVLNRKLGIDHNHLTGKVRELLCQRCNLAIGHLRDSVGIAQRAVEYLKKHSGE